MNHDKMKQLKTIAVDKVIEYALQQGIKLRRRDFVFDSTEDSVEKELNFVSDGWTLKNEKGITVIIRNVNRWKALLAKKKECFLNYANARLINQDIVFTFSYRELEFFEMNKEPDGITSENMEKILSKVDRLLALADLEKNPNEHEAIAASMKAQELLAKYNLSLADIKGEQEEEEIEHVCADIKQSQGSVKWKALLGTVISENYRCKFYRAGNERFIFYGFKTDAVIARRVFIYLVNVCSKLGKTYVAELKKNGKRTDGVLTSFYTGFYHGVKSALEKNCTALALVVPKKVDAEFEKMSAEWETSRFTLKSHDAQAYQKGITEGKRALNAQYIE